MGSVVGAGLVRETGPGYVFLFARGVIIPHNLLSCAVLFQKPDRQGGCVRKGRTPLHPP